MIGWFKGFFEENTSQSSKRLMGILSGAALIVVCLMDAFHAVEIHEWVGYTLAGYSAAALGISTLNFKGKKPE